MNLALFKELSKYPFIYKDEFIDSIELNQNSTCLKKCKEKDCLKLFNESNDNYSEYICSNDYNNFLLKIGDLKVIFNGLIYDTNNQVSKDRRLAKKEWIIDKNAILIFSKKILEVEKHIVRREYESTEKNFSMFHDFKTSMNIFFSCTEDIINSLPGYTFEEKLQNSSKPFQDLYDALELITSQLGMIDIILNPKSISFSNKREINIFRLFDKVTKLFEHLSVKKRNVNFVLNKNGYINNSHCYESIEFIPLILLDNALKYSAPDSNIIIEMRQLYNKVKVTVKNIGPFVSDDNHEKIFEKFFRDEAGEAYSKDGIGMGLWIAQEIMVAHKTKIYYHRDLNETRKIGLNIFEFDLETTY